MSSSAKDPIAFGDLWEQYRKSIPGDAPDDQIYCMKVAFHHSAMTSLKLSISHAIGAIPEITDEEFEHEWDSYIDSAFPDGASLTEISVVRHALQSGSFLMLQHFERVLTEGSLEEKLNNLIILLGEIEALRAKITGAIQ